MNVVCTDDAYESMCVYRVCVYIEYIYIYINVHICMYI